MYRTITPQEQFNWFPPFTSVTPVIITSFIFYPLMILGLRAFMKDRKPITANSLLAAHNFFLAGVSLVMSVGILFELTRQILESGLFAGLYCGVFDNTDFRVARWGMIFYLTKYYELLDTVFLILRKRNLTFLHVFHHLMVIPVCWYGNYSETYMGWITSFNNATVHVFMYYYFAMSALGKQVSWRRYLTTMQIIQFVVDSATSLPFLYYYLVGIPCRGNISAWLVANFTGLSFLWLFVDFYRNNYESQKKRK